ncbi:MAG: hypothetical protein HC906_08930, partial [Bacteroidales bacterium]|nr:hypothetical protein [Bacteroidales bacterium]
PVETDPMIIHKDTLLYTSLTVESQHGCLSTATKSLRIKRPTAMFSMDIDSGCAPLHVTFNDQSLSDETITSRKWVFGDNEVNTGNLSQITHNYLTANTFKPYLIIENNQGCIDTSYLDTVKTGKILHPDFTVNKSVLCPHEMVQFTNTTPESHLIKYWYYYSGNQLVCEDTTNANPVWNVPPDTGFMEIELKVMYNGCYSDTIKQKVLYNKGPVADFNYSFDCGVPFDYTFINSSKGFTSFEWTIGGVVDVVNLNPSYTFTGEGDSTVQLIAYKETCSDTLVELIAIRQPNAVISSDSLLCADVPVTFDGSLSYSFANHLKDKFSWTFTHPDTVYVAESNTINHEFNEGGLMDVKLLTRFDNGCKDSTLTQVWVFQPQAKYVPDTSNGCAPLWVTFADSSKADVHPLDSWLWRFDVGIDSTYSVQKNEIKFLFSLPKVYSVKLEVTDTFGCKNSFFDTIALGNPAADFLVGDDSLCAGEPGAFYFIPNLVDSILWNFGDQFEVNQVTSPLYHTYLDSGKYWINMTSYQYGCYDQADSVLVYVQKADAFFTASDTAWNCYPKLITLNHNSGGQVIVSGEWNLGYGTNLVEYGQQKSITYPEPGLFSPSLSILTSFGCRDSFSRDIVITGPTGTFSIPFTEACRGDEVRFVLGDTNDVYHFEWDFGDGSPFVEGDTVYHTYGHVGDFYPKLILYGDPEGICKPFVVDTLTIYRVVADFEIPDTGMCSGYNIMLTNISEGNDTNRWNFNNTYYSGDVNLEVILQPGDYFADLEVKDIHGCSDTARKIFTVYPLPDITIKEDTLICQGSTITLWATGGDEILWSPSTGLSSTNSYNPDATPDTSITFSATITETTNGCRNSDALFVFVQRKPGLSINPVSTNEDEPFGDSLIIGRSLIYRLIRCRNSLHWSPDYMISCLDCASPTVQPLEMKDYILLVADTNGCFTETYPLNIPVKTSFIIALPTAFIPSGDNEENRILKVRGHGIRNLIEFRIYNRWGNEVFYTDDIEQSWDGTFNGKLQNIDAYGYVVTAEMWDGSIQTKKGTVNLLR